MSEKNQLSPEDQARVDEFISSGYNATDRQPFKPLKLLFILWVIVSVMGLFAWGYARYHGLV